jgi:esterase/lipase superfamily enzyme
MPTPVIYQNAMINPFEHLTTEHKNTRAHVFYATNRAPRFLRKDLRYGNSVDSFIHLGEATVRMGGPDDGWDDLLEFSLEETQLNAVPLTLEIISETAQMPDDKIRSDRRLTTDQQKFIDAINMKLENAIDKEIMVYVHGTKVDFANATILTAEIDYFAGRDFVSLAFAWPSHQNILFYLLGLDVHRALNSSPALTSLLVLLAENTNAEHINILAYSAGGKVTTKALFEMRQAYPELDSNEFRSKFKIASVVFAAVDVEIDTFLERLPVISEMADQVVITLTDDDNALKAAKRFMGGEVRAGTIEAEGIEEAFILENKLSNVEIIDVSYGKEVRGFDITGHHYWYRHPWMSSDIIFLMRTDLPPHRRGLSPTELEGIWYLSPEYPQKIQKAAENELKGQW